MSQAHRATPIGEILSSLEAWYARPDRDPNRVKGWLTGDEMPPKERDFPYEPYWWLLEALGQSKEQSTLAVAVAYALAAILDQRSGGETVAQVAPSLALNALRTAEGLRLGDILADPLDRLARSGRVHGEWLDYSIPKALLDAMRMNQVDARWWKPVWRPLLQTKTTAWGITGTIDDGFDGVLYMPASRERRGRPAVTQLGWALRQRADRLPPTRRGPLFRALCRRVKAVYPGRPQLDLEMIQMAKSADWEPWQVLCLDRLVVRANSLGKRARQASAGRQEYWVWDRVLGRLPERTYHLIEGFCPYPIDGDDKGVLPVWLMLRVSLDDEGARLLAQSSRKLEALRLALPAVSIRAVAGVIDVKDRKESQQPAKRRTRRSLRTKSADLQRALRTRPGSSDSQADQHPVVVPG